MALHGVEGLVDESDEEAVSETLFESGSSSQNDVCVNDQNEALINDGKAQDVIQKSDDPFEIYDILNKPPVNNAVPDPSLSHPPGYTPKQLNSETPVENSCAREESPLLQEDASRADVAKDVGSNVSESVSEFSSNIPTRINSHGGSMLDMLDDIIKVGQSMGYVMEGLGHKTKKEWIKELNFKHRINFLAIQETKLECISDMDFKIEGPIVLKEVSSDYGPTPFRMYHSWFSYEGFHAMVTQAWHSFPHNDSNNLICFKKKLQDLKKIIRGWIFQQNLSKKEMKASLLKQLVDIDKQLENGVKTDEMLLNRLEVSRRLHNLNQSDLNDAAQKAKVKWAIEGDENSKFFHGVINKKRAQLAIRGVFNNGTWCTDPNTVKESRFTSVSRAVNDGLFTGLHLQDQLTLSHLFYADDVIFLGEWSDANLANLIKILKCFHLASGLKINVQKSQLMGVGVSEELVRHGASSIGCAVLTTPFRYLGVDVGGLMTRHSAWSSVIQKIQSRLSRWKANTLSVGGRLTLLKSVLGATPLFTMSIYKVPLGVLRDLERIRNSIWGRESTKSVPLSILDPIRLSPSSDRWVCDLNGEGMFRVKDIRLVLDDMYLPATS
ncbi:hypothetical protein Tco_0855399 [Tanacetum coccineum]